MSHLGSRVSPSQSHGLLSVPGVLHLVTTALPETPRLLDEALSSCRKGAVSCFLFLTPSPVLTESQGLKAVPERTHRSLIRSAGYSENHSGIRRSGFGLQSTWDINGLYVDYLS